MNPLIEIDGERIEYTNFYPAHECIGGYGLPVGTIHGEDESLNDKVRCFKINKSVGVVNVFRPGWGIKGIFKNALWTQDENGTPLFQVSERIA